MTSDPAPILLPAARTYRGSLTRPERWATWQPQRGDVLVCTPPKSGTTWTQSMIAMLLQGGTDLPQPVPVLSPWVDSDLGEADAVTAALAAQTGRRVVKTHTPADGFAVWDGVTVVAVYRHPLDVFISLRKHAQNMDAAPDHRMRQPVAASLDHFISEALDTSAFDNDSLATVIHHFVQTTQRNRLPDLHVFHYADMVADPRAAVARLAGILGTGHDTALIDAVLQATGFDAMRANAAHFVPEGGTGFWADDRAFFDKGGTGRWQGLLSDADLARYDARMADLLPDPDLRAWIESGGPALR